MKERKEEVNININIGLFVSSFVLLFVGLINGLIESFAIEGSVAATPPIVTSPHE